MSGERGTTAGVGGELDPQVDAPPHQRSTVRDWALLLVGPVLWITHFGIVYLFAEAACAAREAGDAFRLPGTGAISPVIVVSTVVLAAVTAAATVVSWRTIGPAGGDREVMARGGALLGVLSVIAILAVGLPAIWLDPC